MSRDSEETALAASGDLHRQEVPTPIIPLKICRVVNVATSVEMLADQLSVLVRHGVDLTIVAAESRALADVAKSYGFKVRALPIIRKPSLGNDLRALALLAAFFKAERFDVVHSSYSKPGFLAMMAARIARVPVRMHTFTGQVWLTLNEPLRTVVRFTDRATGALATNTYADSPSQAAFLTTQGIIRRDKIAVLGSGSIAGVRLDRFVPRSLGEPSLLRQQLGIPGDAFVFTFLGRVVADKGIAELLDAFSRVNSTQVAHLIVAGPTEPVRAPLTPALLAALTTTNRVHYIGAAAAPLVLHAADVLCLPSYREGFGVVVIEAAACKVPTIATRIVGLVDSVSDGETGLLVPPRDAIALSRAMLTLMASPNLRTRMGEAARARVVTEFDSAVIANLQLGEYRRLVMQTRVAYRADRD